MRLSPLFLFSATALCLCAAAVVPSVSAQEKPAAPAPSSAPASDPAAAKPGKYDKEIAGLEKRIEAGKFPVGGIAFVGSSTMRLWKLDQCFPDWKLANLGFGGANIPDQLEHFDTLLGKLKPKQVIFYCGGNDLAQKRMPEQVLADFTTWVGMMKKLVPDCDITFLSIRPSSSRKGILEQETKANTLVKAYCEAQKLKYAGLEDTVVKADGSIDDSLFLPDKLHLNDAGYKIWSAKVLPLLNSKLPH